MAQVLMTDLQMNATSAYQQACQALQSGDKATARRLLTQVLRAEPRNIHAWLRMSDVVETPEQQLDCLLRVLSIDPQNETAQARLQDIQAQQVGQYPSDPATTRLPAFPQPGSSSPTQPPVSTFDTGALRPETAPLRHPMQKRQAALSSRQQAHDVLNEETLKRGYRNITLAGAMTLSMLCGIALLIATLTMVVPWGKREAQERPRTTPEPVLYTATLWCPPCEQAGSLVVLWEKVGDGTSRGGKTGELPHNTIVAVLAKEWSEPEGRFYFKVTAMGQKGWIPETFIKE